MNLLPFARASAGRSRPDNHDRRHHFVGRPNGTYFIYPYWSVPSTDVSGAHVLVLLPELRRVLPVHIKLPGVVGVGARFLTMKVAAGSELLGEV